jgi:hypothetical protein
MLSLAEMPVARRTTPIRFVIAMLLAVLASVRGGGIALVCDLAPIEETYAAAMADHGMPMQHDAPQHGQHGTESCDSPDGVQECAAMAACAPAIAATVADDTPCRTERSIASAVAGARSLVDRSPDPPPPRA